MAHALSTPIDQDEEVIPFTADAYQKIKDRYQALKTERIAVMERLKIAREMGDLSENAAYKYAKLELGDLGRELRRLKYLIKHGQVTTKQGDGQTVEFGCQVTVQINQTSKQTTFTIVSQHESDPKQRKISTDSPLGQALIHKKLGETVIVSAPAGKIAYTILTIT